jgi:hypothetical protein
MPIKIKSHKGKTAIKAPRGKLRLKRGVDAEEGASGRRSELRVLAKREMGKVVSVYVCRQTACRELDMSDDTFDKYAREGTLPQPKRRGGLVRWKWSEIVAALDGGSIAVIEVEQDAFETGIARAREANLRAA